MAHLENFTFTEKIAVKGSLEKSKKNNDYVITDNVRKMGSRLNDAINKEEDESSSPDTQKTNEKEYLTEFTNILDQNERYFSSTERQTIITVFRKSPNEEGINALIEEVKTRLEEHAELTALCKNYGIQSPERNEKYKSMTGRERKSFLIALKNIEEKLSETIHQGGLLNRERLEKTMIKCISFENSSGIEILLGQITKIFEKEKLRRPKFNQLSELEGLPFPVKKMSDESLKFYFEYYMGEDFAVREKAIENWQIIVNHEELLLKRFLDLFTDYPEALSQKLTDFSKLDFVSKDKYLKSAEVEFPAKKKEKVVEKEEKVEIKNPKETEAQEKAPDPKKTISMALEMMQHGTPELGLTSLLEYKRKYGSNPKIEFYIKMILKYIEEFELNKEKEEIEKQKSEEQTKAEEKQMKQDQKIKEKTDEVLSTIALRRVVRQERLIAKNIKGAQKNERLHNGEKDAINRSKKQNKKEMASKTDCEITDIFYENETDHIINASGKSERLTNLKIQKGLGGLDSDMMFTLNKTTEIHEKELSENGSGFSHINFVDEGGETISASTALEKETQKIDKHASKLSKKITDDLRISDSSKIIDLKALLKERISKESGLAN